MAYRDASTIHCGAPVNIPQLTVGASMLTPGGRPPQRQIPSGAARIVSDLRNLGLRGIPTRSTGVSPISRSRRITGKVTQFCCKKVGGCPENTSRTSTPHESTSGTGSRVSDVGESVLEVGAPGLETRLVSIRTASVSTGSRCVSILHTLFSTVRRLFSILYRFTESGCRIFAVWI